MSKLRCGGLFFFFFEAPHERRRTSLGSLASLSHRCLQLRVQSTTPPCRVAASRHPPPRPAGPPQEGLYGKSVCILKFLLFELPRIDQKDPFALDAPSVGVSSARRLRFCCRQCGTLLAYFARVAPMLRRTTPSPRRRFPAQRARLSKYQAEIEARRTACAAAAASAAEARRPPPAPPPVSPPPPPQQQQPASPSAAAGGGLLQQRPPQRSGSSASVVSLTALGTSPKGEPAPLVPADSDPLGASLLLAGGGSSSGGGGRGSSCGSR